MISTLFRVLFGFVLASLVAGVIKVGFVMPPPDIIALPDDVMYNRLGDAGMLSLVAGTQSAVFAAPFALVAAAIAEWQGIRGMIYYVLAGLLIAAGGLLALFAGESDNAPTIVNTYAILAYLLAGLGAGITYWLFAGRWAGDPQVYDAQATTPSTMGSKPPVTAASTPSRPAPSGPPKKA